MSRIADTIQAKNGPLKPSWTNETRLQKLKNILLTDDVISTVKKISTDKAAEGLRPWP